jgi:hypothetical protein
MLHLYGMQGVDRDIIFYRTVHLCGMPVPCPSTCMLKKQHLKKRINQLFAKRNIFLRGMVWGTQYTKLPALRHCESDSLKQ